MIAKKTATVFLHLVGTLLILHKMATLLDVLCDVIGRLYPNDSDYNVSMSMSNKMATNNTPILKLAK